MKMFNCVMVGALMAICAGCKSATWMAGGEEGLEAYLAEVEEVFKDAEAMGVPEMVSPGGAMTTREASWGYEVIYVDEGRRYFSFRQDHNYYSGGAHGLCNVTVGTIDRQTGRRLTLEEVVPKYKRAEVLAQVRHEVVETIQGEEHLLGEPTLTENFYLAADGIHFVFGEYEVAPYCYGIINVAVPLPTRE